MAMNAKQAEQDPRPVRCRFCEAYELPVIKMKLSNTGLLSVVLWLIFCFPLAWLPFLAIAFFTNVLGGMPWVVLLVPPVVFVASRFEGERFLRLPYLGYWFYPLHLFVLLALRAVLL